MRTSILLTVHDREPELILPAMRSLYRAGIAAKDSDSEVILANDRSAMDYSWLRAYADQHFANFIWRDVPDYEAFRMPGGGNGPSRAFNEALCASSGTRIIAMSSDVIITPEAWKESERIDSAAAIWSPIVWDLDAVPFREYCGPTRLFPAPWFLLMDRAKLLEVGGWDEAYLQGIAFDDNDLIARIGLSTGLCFLSTDTYVFHQSHAMTAYSADEATREGWNRNRKYTRDKWGGIPMDKTLTPMDITRIPHPSGRLTYKFKAAPEVLARAVAMTEGILATV